MIAIIFIPKKILQIMAKNKQSPNLRMPVGSYKNFYIYIYVYYYKYVDLFCLD